MEKRSKLIALVISVIIGIAVVVWFMYAPAPQLAIHSPVTEEHYDMLKENALEFAKTLDKRVIENKEIVPEFYYGNDELIIIVESSTAKVTAQYSVSNSLSEIEEGIIILNGKVDYENVTYSGESKIDPVEYYLLLSIGCGLLLGWGIYMGLTSFISRKKRK